MLKPTCAFLISDMQKCPAPAVSRGLCKKHWAYCAKRNMLPPKKRRVPLVLVKLYLTTAQLTALRKLSRANSERLSSLMRRAIQEWLVEAGQLERV